MLSPKTLKYLRLTHRYVSFICAGILFVYLLSGFLLNHRKEFTFMNQKKERTVDYIFQLLPIKMILQKPMHERLSPISHAIPTCITVSASVKTN